VYFRFAAGFVFSSKERHYSRRIECVKHFKPRHMKRPLQRMRDCFDRPQTPVAPEIRVLE
jgi:hypothetical protein